jgi:hypothetical protein
MSQLSLHESGALSLAISLSTTGNMSLGLVTAATAININSRYHFSPTNLEQM